MHYTAVENGARSPLYILSKQPQRNGSMCVAAASHIFAKSSARPSGVVRRKRRAETIPRLHRDRARRCHMCIGTGLAPCHISAPGLGSPLPTSAPSLGSPLPHLLRDGARPLPHLRRD